MEDRNKNALLGSIVMVAGATTFAVISTNIFDTARNESLLEGIDQGKTWAYQDVKIKLTEGLGQKYPFKIHEIGYEFIPTNTGEIVVKALISPLKKKEALKNDD